MKRKKVTLQIIGICLMMLFLCEGCKEQEIQMTEEVAEEPSSRKEEESQKVDCTFGNHAGEAFREGYQAEKQSSLPGDGQADQPGLSCPAAPPQALSEESDHTEAQGVAEHILRLDPDGKGEQEHQDHGGCRGQGHNTEEKYDRVVAI